MKHKLNPYLANAMDSRYDVAKVESAINAAYNDGTTVVESEEKLTGTKVQEKKDNFSANEQEKRVRSGKVNDPLRMLNFSTGLTKFFKTYGEPATELSLGTIPAGLTFWLEAKFKLTAEQLKAREQAKAEQDKATEAIKPNASRNGKQSPVVA